MALQYAFPRAASAAAATAGLYLLRAAAPLDAAVIRSGTLDSSKPAAIAALGIYFVIYFVRLLLKTV